MKLSLVMIGCGAIARRHAKTLQAFGSRVRVGFASRDAQRAQTYRQECRGFAAFDGYSAAFSDPHVDAVMITTPPAYHLDLTLEAARSGKHVIVEKPPFLHSSDIDAVASAAHDANVEVLVAENYAYKPLTIALGRLLDAKEIGAPRLVRLSALKHQETHDWRDSEELAGGGALFEGGVHWVNLLGWLGPEIVDVQGFLPANGQKPERTIVVVVRYANGAIGTLHHSWEAPAKFKGMSVSQIIGDKGTIVFESNGSFVAVNGKRRRIVFPGFRDTRGFHAMFDDFLTTLSTGATPRMTLARAKQDLSVIEAAYRTAEQR
ncbi:MAG TPA: Gfo/Idh/MocA family oxidoreductase [Gemmatimonadaceae bacterium]